MDSKRRITKQRLLQNGESQNSDCYKTAKSQNSNSYKTATTAKQRLLTNGDYYKTKTVAKKYFRIFNKNGDYYKTAKVYTINRTYSKIKCIYSVCVERVNFCNASLYRGNVALYLAYKNDREKTRELCDWQQN